MNSSEQDFCFIKLHLKENQSIWGRGLSVAAPPLWSSLFPSQADALPSFPVQSTRYFSLHKTFLCCRCQMAKGRERGVTCEKNRCNILEWEIQVGLAAAGRELILFLAPLTVFYFRFRMGITLVGHWCFSCCWVVLALYLQFSVLCLWEGAQGTQREPGQDNDPARPKGHSRPWNVMSSGETGGRWLGRANGCSGTGWASINRWWTHKEYYFVPKRF